MEKWKWYDFLCEQQGYMSGKRVAGFVCLVAAIAFAAATRNSDVFSPFLIAAGGLLGAGVFEGMFDKRRDRS